MTHDQARHPGRAAEETSPVAKTEGGFRQSADARVATGYLVVHSDETKAVCSFALAGTRRRAALLRLDDEQDHASKALSS